MMMIVAWKPTINKGTNNQELVRSRRRENLIAPKGHDQDKMMGCQLAVVVWFATGVATATLNSLVWLAVSGRLVLDPFKHVDVERHLGFLFLGLCYSTRTINCFLLGTDHHILCTMYLPPLLRRMQRVVNWELGAIIQIHSQVIITILTSPYTNSRPLSE